MLADPYGAAATGPTPVEGPHSDASGWFGRKGARCARTRPAPTPGPPAAVRDAEGLVQVQVRHVRPEPTGLRQAHEGVEVRAVDIHLTSRVVDLGAEVGDGLLEDSVRRRVGHHDRRKVVRVLGDPGGEVGHIDIPARRGLDDDDPHPAMTAEAALVPCALAGMRHTRRWPSPRDSW